MRIDSDRFAKKKQRNEIIRNYKLTLQQIAQEPQIWSAYLVNGRAEYYDELTTEDALNELR